MDEVEHDIMRKPNSVIVLLDIFHIIHPQKQKRNVQPFCFWGEHSKGLSNKADCELDMINAISAADIAFIMSSSQAIVNWLNALGQSDFSKWVWCIITIILNTYIITFLLVSLIIFDSTSWIRKWAAFFPRIFERKQISHLPNVH